MTKCVIKQVKNESLFVEWYTNIRWYFVLEVAKLIK